MTSIFDSNAFNQNLFFPRPDSTVAPIDSEDIFVDVDKNCKVHVRIYNSIDAKFSILFFHGNGEIVSDYNNISKYFIGFGCEFIVCDYRGYGKSEGTPTLKSTLTDATKVYCYLKDNKVLKNIVCVMGRSIGSAPAIELCSRFPSITCCVIESGYADPIPLVARRGLQITSMTADENALYNNSSKIRMVKCPILLMHGEIDSLINPEEAKLNYKNAYSKNKKLEILKGVGHNDMMMADNNKYFASLSIFFSEVLS